MNILERALAALLCLPFLTGCMGHKTAEEPETVEEETLSEESETEEDGSAAERKETE